MLKLPLPALARGDVRLDEEIAPNDPLWEGLEVQLAEPVHVNLRGQSVGDGVLVRGRIKTTFDVPCRRCLTSVAAPLVQEVDLLFVPPMNGDEEEDLGGEVYPLPLRGTELDIGDAVREQVVLAAPTYVVCRADCRGLCLKCGTDLNEAECGCVPDAAPSPWDVLKKLERNNTD